MLALALGFLAPALAGAGAGWRWGSWLWRWQCAQHWLFNTDSCACQLGSWTSADSVHCSILGPIAGRHCFQFSQFSQSSVSGRWPFSSVSQFSQFSSVFLAGGLSVQFSECFWSVAFQFSSVQFSQSVFLAGGLSVQFSQHGWTRSGKPTRMVRVGSDPWLSGKNSFGDCGSTGACWSNFAVLVLVLVLGGAGAGDPDAGAGAGDPGAGAGRRRRWLALALRCWRWR